MLSRALRAYRHTPAAATAHGHAPQLPAPAPRTRGAWAAVRRCAARAASPQSAARQPAPPASPARRHRRPRARAAPPPQLWAAAVAARAAQARQHEAAPAHPVRALVPQPQPPPRPSQAAPTRRWPPAHTAARTPEAPATPFRGRSRKSKAEGRNAARCGAKHGRAAAAPGDAHRPGGSRAKVAVPETRRRAGNGCRTV